MKQATLVDIAESCKVARNTAWRWATKAGVKISSIKNKWANAKRDHPAVFNKDEIVCILTEGDAGLGMLAEENLNKIDSKIDSKMDSNPTLVKSSKDSGKNYQSPTLDQQLKVVELTVRMAELFEHTTSGASADYCLNWAKKRLSGKNNGDSYTPIMNLLEAPDNKKTTKRGDE